jgi:hypothetical protein
VRQLDNSLTIILALILSIAIVNNAVHHSCIVVNICVDTSGWLLEDDAIVIFTFSSAFVGLIDASERSVASSPRDFDRSAITPR